MYLTVVAMCGDWDAPKIVSTYDNRVEAQKAADTINKTTHMKAWIAEPPHNQGVGKVIRIFQCHISDFNFETPRYWSYETIRDLEDGPEPPEVEETGEGCWVLWAFNQQLLESMVRRLAANIKAN